MAKFTDKQVLELFSYELARRIKSDQEYLGSQQQSEFRLVVQSRISLLNDLKLSLEFYRNYEYD